MINKSRGAVLIAFALVLSLIPFSANSNSHGAGPQTPPCGIYKVKKDEVIAGVNFPKGSYQINAFGISCSKVLGSKGLFAQFLKLKDKDPLPKPWKYLSDAVGAPKFSSGPGVGFRVQSISTPLPSPSSTPAVSAPAKEEKVDSLSLDPRVSKNTLLSAASICKNIDKTPDYGPLGATTSRNGFPRPKEATYPSGKAKVLVIPFTYTTWPFLTKLPAITNRTVTDLEALQKVNREVEELVKRLSAGKFELEISILPESEWLTLDPELGFDSTPMTDNFGPIKKMIIKNDGKIDFEKYDSYVFVSTLGAPIPPVAQATYSTEVKTSKGQANKLVLMTQGWQSSALYFHELGHSMFGLEDLYLFSENKAEWLPSELAPIMGWDLMASSQLEVLSNWNRLLMGWLSDSEIRCLADQSQSTHYLSDFTKKGQPQLLLINLAPGVSLAAESRIWGETQRLLLYVIDTNISHGQGPVRSLNTLLKAGESKELFDWKFNVLETSKDGLLLEVSKGSGKAYVAPVIAQNNSGPRQPDSPIGLTGGELIRKSATNAEIRWNPSNYQSYRVYVTATDDYQKVYFESDKIDSTANPLVVQITGLVCGVDLRVMSMFFTNKGGQGESRVEQKILRSLKCQG